MSSRVSDTATLVRLLVEANVEFIVVGMSAAVFLGVPATTLDLDIVHRRTPENIARLMALLPAIGAYYRHDLANRMLRPTEEALAGGGHQNLQTQHGPLDLLGQLDELGYDELVPRSILVEDGGITLRVLDLPALIEVKTRAARPKDKLALPLLLATLDERRRRGS
ncbi:MAG: hypothetical protein SFX73_40625 [Kofleriaceae bacterium]|nr:hypothetical protein [Kofleriaceae bacterium]